MSIMYLVPTNHLLGFVPFLDSLFRQLRVVRRAVFRCLRSARHISRITVRMTPEPAKRRNVEGARQDFGAKHEGMDQPDGLFVVSQDRVAILPA
jgi:hypothetical protein